MPEPSLHAIVHGHVQGVYFRASTQAEAGALGLGGWVQNLPQGMVEVYAVGARPVLEKLLDWLHQGPPGARVTRVEVEWGEASAPVPLHFVVTG